MEVSALHWQMFTIITKQIGKILTSLSFLFSSLSLSLSLNLTDFLEHGNKWTVIRREFIYFYFCVGYIFVHSKSIAAWTLHYSSIWEYLTNQVSQYSTNGLVRYTFC
jgi:hypothetical protein